MPPLNRLLEDQENNVWRSPNQPQNDGRRGSFSALVESPLKPTNEDLEDPTSERRARFSEKANQVCSIIGRGDYSEQEIGDCWYSASDYATFRRDICTTVYLHKIDPKRIDGLEYTVRGVEHRMEGASSRRSSLRSRAKSAVLDEQDFQNGLGESSSVDYIAGEYSRVANEAVYYALNLAALDQVEVSRYQCESEYEDLFTDDWISSISTASSLDSACSEETHNEADMSFVEDDVSGFDDSWLRDVLVGA